MSKQTTFTKCFEQLCKTNQTEIKNIYANDFIAWCKVINILVSGGAFNQDATEQYLYINE